MLKNLLMLVSCVIAFAANDAQAFVRATLLSNGTLSIEGDDFDNHITVWVDDDGDVRVGLGEDLATVSIFAGKSGNASINSASVNGLEIHTLGGDDRIVVDFSWHKNLNTANMDVEIDGGDDDDFIDTGKRGYPNNYIVEGGNGADTVTVYATWVRIGTGRFALPRWIELSASLDDFDASEGDRKSYKLVLQR